MGDKLKKLPKLHAIRHMVNNAFELYPGNRKAISEHIATRLELFMVGVDVSLQEDREDILIKFVAHQFKVAPSKVRGGKCRERDVVDARFVLFHIFHTIIGYNKSATGRKFDMDHSSVIHGCYEFETQYSRNDLFKIRALKSINFADKIFFNDNKIEIPEDAASA